MPTDISDLAEPVSQSSGIEDLADPVSESDVKYLDWRLKHSLYANRQTQIPGAFAAEGPVPSVPWGPFTPGSVGGGMLQSGLDVGSALSRVIPLGATGDDFQHAAQNIDVAQQQAGEGMVGEFVRGGVRSLLPSVVASPLGTAGVIATGAAIQGSQSLTEARDRDLPESQARAFALRSAVIEGGMEAVVARYMPTLETVIGKGMRGGLKPRKALELASKTIINEMGQEVGTEAMHVTNEWLSGVSEDEVTSFAVTERLLRAAAQAAVLTGGVTGTSAALSVAERPGRLAQLKEIRKSDNKDIKRRAAEVGITGSRTEVRKQLNAEIKQLEQEIQNAPGVPEAEGEVRQEQGRETLREQGQVEVPAEPAGEVAPTPEVQVAPEPPAKPGYVRVYHSGGPQDGSGRWVSTDKAYASNYRPDAPLHYLDIPASDPRVNNPDYPEQGAKQGFTFNFETTPEEAAKLVEIQRELPPKAAEQPRDVAAEIRTALAEGPVTVTTPQVQGGFKVAKVRDDGKVVTKKGRVLTPDETWTVQPFPTQEKPSAQPEPVREAVPPVPQAPPVPAAAPEAVPQAAPGEAGTFAAKPKATDKWRVSKDGDRFVVQSTVGGGHRYTTIPGARYETELEARATLERLKGQSESGQKPPAALAAPQAATEAPATSEPSVPPQAPQAAQERPRTAGQVVSARGQRAIPGLEQEAAAREKVEAEDARWTTTLSELSAVGGDQFARDHLPTLRQLQATVNERLKDEDATADDIAADLELPSLPAGASGKQIIEHTRIVTEAVERLMPAKAADAPAKEALPTGPANFGKEHTYSGRKRIFVDGPKGRVVIEQERRGGKTYEVYRSRYEAKPGSKMPEYKQDKVGFGFTKEEARRAAAKAVGGEMPAKPRGKKPKPQEAAEDAQRGVSGEASKPTDRPDIEPKPGSGAMLQPVQAPELFQIAKELMGKEPGVKKLGGAAGRFRGQEGVGPLAILIDPKTAESEQALGQTLAHEIGHLIDFLPENTLKRGNLLGRLKSLRGFLKHTFPSLPDNSVVRKELIELTKWWSGDYTGGKDSYVKYRESSRELYAEALSVFLNSPGDLETRAPAFYKALLANLNAKPDVLAAYSTLQQMLNGTGQELAEARTQTLRDMFGRAEEHINSLRVAQEQQKKSAWSGVVDFLGQYFLTSAQPVLTRLGRKPIKRGESAEAEAARFALDELFTIDSPNHTFLRNIDEQVYQPLIEAMQGRGLDRKAAEAEANFTIGEYLYHWRVANERDAVANPAGFTATPSAAQLEAIKRRIGDQAYAKLQEYAGRFHDLVYAVAKKAAEEGVYNRKTFDELITPNKDNYAAFRVTHHIDDPDIIATGVIKQVGTFSDIQNPFHATVLKVVRLNRLIELNRAKNRVRVFLEKNFPGDIKPVETVFTGEGRPRIPKKHPAKGKEHLVELVDGHPNYFEVPTEIAKSFAVHDIGGLGRIGALINSAAYKVFHPFFVTYNPGFVLANPFRDLRRTWVNLGSTDNISLSKLASEWAKALPVAIRRQKGIEDAVIRQMLDSHAIDIPYNDVAAEDIDSQIDQLFQKYGLRGDNPQRLLEKIPVIGRVLEFIEHAGAVTETATKVAAWRVLEEKGVPIPERSYRVRKYAGTPDYKQRGLATALTNPILMYSRVRWNALQADVGLATNPDTAAGWWWRQLVNVVLPTSLAKAAAYGAFGMALRAMFGVDDDDKESVAGKAATWTDETGKRIAKYFLTDYDVIPLGVNREGKAVFVTIPRDDLGKFIARTWWHLTDSAQIASGHELRAGEGGRDVAGHLFTDLKQELLPSFSPPIEITSKWLQYGAGINPVDSFYNQQIIPRKEWTAGGWAADSKMIAWTLDKFGSPGALVHYPLSPLLGESFETGTSGGTEAVMKTAGAATGLNRFLRISDSGLTSDQWAKLENADQEAAAFRRSLPKAATEASTRRYFLMRREALGDRLSDAEQNELHELNLFYNAAYMPLRQMIQESKDGEPLKQDMKRAASNPKGLWSDAPNSIKAEVESYKQGVVLAAVASPPDKSRADYQEKLAAYNEAMATSRARLKHFGPSFEEAKQLLMDYYKRPNEKGVRGKLGDAYLQRLGALKRLYGVE